MQNLINTQQLINDFAYLSRSHYIPNKADREGDLHHSASVAFLAWQIHDQLGLNLDMAKIMKYALAHDIVEIYAGDVNAYASKEERENKRIREAESLARLRNETSLGFPDLTEAIEAYESRSDDEAWFVWSVDKIQALVQGALDDNRCFYEQGITSEMVSSVHGRALDQAYPAIQDLSREVLARFLSNYDDLKVKTDKKPTNSPAART